MRDRPGVVIITGTERQNGTTASRSGFYKNMIIYGTERVAFRLLQESYNFRNGTELFRILQECDNLRNGTAERTVIGRNGTLTLTLTK